MNSSKKGNKANGIHYQALMLYRLASLTSISTLSMSESNCSTSGICLLSSYYKASTRSWVFSWSTNSFKVLMYLSYSATLFLRVETSPVKAWVSVALLLTMSLDLSVTYLKFFSTSSNSFKYCSYACLYWTLTILRSSSFCFDCFLNL